MNQNTKSFCSFFSFYIALSVLILNDFSVVTKRWHLSPFAFMQVFLNHVYKFLHISISTNLYSFLTWLRQCINVSHMCDLNYHLCSWKHYIGIFQSTCCRCLKEKDLTDSEFYMLYECRGCRNYLFCLLSLIKVTEKK